jgi:hypothetical protein
MKKIIFAFSLLLGYSASAQLDIGLRAGINLSNPRIENFQADGTISDLKTDGSEISYQVGAYTRLKLNVLFVQGELYFSQINQSAVATFDAVNVPSKNIDLSFSRINLPLLVGLKLGPVRLMGGPAFSANFNDVSGNLNNDLQIATVSYQVGLGAEFKKLFIDLRYEAGFGDWASEVIIENSDYQADISTQQIMLCVGLELF